MRILGDEKIAVYGGLETSSSVVSLLLSGIALRCSATQRHEDAGRLTWTERSEPCVEGQVALTKDKKETVIGSYRTHDKDTGSPEVQVALLSERINYLTEHF